MFNVEEPYRIEHYAYDTSLTDDPLMANYYFGLYNGSKRGIYVYTIDSKMIVEFEKSGIVSKDLLDMSQKNIHSMIR